MRAALQGLEVDAERATANLDRGLGLTGSEALSSALTPALGRPRAHELTGRLADHPATEKLPLHEVAAADPDVVAVLDPAALKRALRPATSLQLVSPLIDRALATHGRLGPSEGTRWRIRT